MKSKAVASIMAGTMLLGSLVFGASQNYNTNYSIDYSIAGNAITVTNNVKNPSAEDKDVLCIVAKYDAETKNLIEAHAESLFIPKNINQVVGVDYTYPVSAGQIIKMMIWDAETIQPYSFDQKSLIAIREKETFDEAKIQYPQYKMSGGQYVYKPVAEQPPYHLDTLNDRETEIPGGILNPSSGFTYEGDSYHDGTTNLAWEVASIVGGALFIDGQGATAAANTYVPAKLRINLNKEITEDVTIGTKFKFSSYATNDAKLDFMSLYDENGKRIVHIADGAYKLSFYSGANVGGTFGLDKEWHEMSYKLNMLAGTYTVVIDGKTIGTFAFENKPTGSIDYLYFSNGSTSAVTSNCHGFYLDDISLSNGL